MSDGIAHIIQNILKQCSTTTISIGHTEGHFLSAKQLTILAECADSLEALESAIGINTPTSSAQGQNPTEEHVIRARRSQVAQEIKQKQIQLSTAAIAEKPQLNLDLGKLLSERAKLDKLIKQFEATA